MSTVNKTIEIENLSIGYPSQKETKVVAGQINAHINKGELTCLLGANGIGKSTLLRTLSAFQPKLDGEIRIQGKEIEKYTSKQLSRVIGVVLTDRLDIRNMTSEELIGLGRSPYTGFWGGLSKEDKRVVSDAITLIRIENLTHRMIQTLSDGERQKVMIAKALVQETPIVFLDEPTAFLDFPSKVEIMQLLHRLSREIGKTIFLSTHDLELALQIADKLWIMDKEHGVKIGTPEDLSLNGNLNDTFARKGVSFDMETGLFRVDNTLTKEIGLIGEGQRYAMARKALQRNGIKVNPDSKTPPYIEVLTNNTGSWFKVHTSNGTIRINSIEALLDVVKVHFNT